MRRKCKKCNEWMTDHPTKVTPKRISGCKSLCVACVRLAMRTNYLEITVRMNATTAAEIAREIGLDEMCGGDPNLYPSRRAMLALLDALRQKKPNVDLSDPLLT